METISGKTDVESRQKTAMSAAALLVKTGARLMYHVPYTGDEQPFTYIRQHMDEFMLTKPA